MTTIGRCKRLLIIVSSALAFSACSTTLLPPPKPAQFEWSIESEQKKYMGQLRTDWNVLINPSASSQKRNAAITSYNRVLLDYVRFVRQEYRKSYAEGKEFKIVGANLDISDATLYEGDAQDFYMAIIPGNDVKMESLKEHYDVTGIGVPLVGVVPPDKVEEVGVEYPINTRGTVQTLTAVMEFPRDKNKLPTLRLLDRFQREDYKVGRHQYKLAGDFSAAMEIYWNLTNIKKWRLLGLMNPQKLRDVTGLSCMEQYDPNRIPVILTHGLASNAQTFSQLVNRLNAYEEIRCNYQFWYFTYPTGQPWTISAAKYRESLAQVRLDVDPKKKNKNWDNMIVLGHSMGGLITHYSQCKEPWWMLRTSIKMSKLERIAHRRFINEPIPEEPLNDFRDVFYFEPVKAARVIYFATPHQGAPLADWGIVNLAIKLISVPEGIIDETFKLATLQEDSIFLNPESILNSFTSVNQLSYASASIQGLRGLEVRDVPTDSFIGDRGRDDSPDSSDGVVPYWSSNISLGSETIIPEGHSVQDNPKSAMRMREILIEHLDRCKVSRKYREGH